mmetsp:Transcript_42517/g.102410  ORF Transcript_42517/g.102410 Transcript_42517/m.102410 type:complete len:321 (-) Transcript_42517:118-1080(-)
MVSSSRSNNGLVMIVYVVLVLQIASIQILMGLVMMTTTTECSGSVGAFSLLPVTNPHATTATRRARNRLFGGTTSSIITEQAETTAAFTATIRPTSRTAPHVHETKIRMMVCDSNAYGVSYGDAGDDDDYDDNNSILDGSTTRRTFFAVPITFMSAAAATATATASSSSPATAADSASASSPSSSSSSPDDLLKQVQQASRQLEPVPQLIKDQKWDAVRAILIEPPLADCWKKTNRPLLQKYAEVVDDELAALEAKEELVSHLRYLDMAVYNNVFNPIATEGQSGATKELIRSYYEDPINEYKASIKAFDELLQLKVDYQ